ncbi:hypothetical protein [Frigoriflavimonas asaccharolytica]|uniref:Uncharacterized protein n=1 Tax=Frigoriflavimonas asaccharolytica TaxID=2735899 RepID=A0A8J8G6P8_9FLAO|nr:hypothetical protein [Frigoriflavimonas asaccharolytica]NRS92259.1 hypothetical protein [Frigoriflavimonas asaccharolytica]
MKRIILLLLTGFTTFIYAQKAEIEKKKVTIKIPKNEFYKGLNTYDIIIQGDDSWNKEYAHKTKKTYEHNVTKNSIENYSKKDTINPDFRVFMGYKGATYKKSSNGQFALDGDFKYLILDKNNEIIYEKGLNAAMYSVTYNGKPNQSLTNDLNNLAYKYIGDNNLITNEKEFTLNYGIFEKADKFEDLIEFNTKTDEFLNKIENNSLDNSYLSGLEKFYSSFVGKEYKKINSKDLNEIVYLNLSLVNLFLSNFDQSLEYLETAKQNVGMFSMWPTNTKSIIDSFILVNSKNSGVKINNLSYDSVYYINLDGSVIQKGQAKTGKLKIDRFANLSEGSLMKSDDPTKAKVWIYKDNGDADFVLVDDATTIKTNNGVELNFISYNNKFLLAEKTNDACYKQFESNSDVIYCNQNGKFEIRK